MINSGLSRRLAACLTPVTAPRDLWDRLAPAINAASLSTAAAKAPVPPQPRTRAPKLAAVLAGCAALSAAAVLAAVALLPPSSAALAWAFHRAPNLALRSADPTVIATWLNAQGLEAPISPGRGIQVCGATILRRPGSGEPVAAIRFEAGGQPATLLVHRHSAPDSAAPVPEPGLGATLYRWTRNGREYLLIASTQAACGLCHPPMGRGKDVG